MVNNLWLWVNGFINEEHGYGTIRKLLGIEDPEFTAVAISAISRFWKTACGNCFKMFFIFQYLSVTLQIRHLVKK